MTPTRTHPGEVLREEFMEPLGLTASDIARAADVPRDRIAKIAREQKGVSADTALRFGKLFGTTPQFWMNLQAAYDLSNVEPNVHLEKVRELVT